MTNELRELLSVEIREQVKRYREYPGRDNRDRLAELIRMARDCRAYDAMGETGEILRDIRESIEGVAVNIDNLCEVTNRK